MGVTPDTCRDVSTVVLETFPLGERNFSVMLETKEGSSMRNPVLEELDRDRLIEIARNLADIVSITGEEKEVAEYLGSEFEQLGMEIEYQEVEEGRPNVRIGDGRERC